jgi:hypothetical protein
MLGELFKNGSMMPNEIEALGKSYKPDSVKLLYLAECPKNNLEHFYNRGTRIYRRIKESFAEVYPEQFTEANFLEFFQSKGCYLLYLSYEPIADLPGDPYESYRIRKRREGVDFLAEKIKECTPQYIIMIMREIEDKYRDALRLSGIAYQTAFAIDHPTDRVYQLFLEKNIDFLRRHHI